MTHPESKLQAEIVSALSLCGAYVFSIPNDGAGRGSVQKTMRLKAMGLRPGIADLALVSHDGHIFFMEVKTPEGTLSPSQKLFQSWCMTRGWPYAVVRSVEEALAVAKTWELIR